MTHPKPPTEMTDAELTDALAIEAMEWRKAKGRCGDEAWFDSNDTPQSRVDRFDPLRNHNHTANCRAKMREMGWTRMIAQYEPDGHTQCNYINKTRDKFVSTSNKDELHAEAIAMIEAIRKEVNNAQTTS